MTCSKNFGRLLQASCLGLIGMLTVVGCGGSETKTAPDSGVPDGGSGGTTGAALNVTPSAVTVGSVDLGKSGTATVVVTNTGTATTGTLSVIPGAGVTATGCTGTLAAKATCNLIITATPTVLGGFNSTVTISANPGAITPLQISVTGTAVPVGQFSVIPSAIDLGNIPVGAAAAKQTITVTASTALTDLAVTSSGPDVAIDKAASTCTAALAAGAACTVVVNFTAVSAGAKSDSLVISAGGINGKTVTVPVTAIAQNPAKLVISPSTAQAFATSVGVPSSAITFGVANSGDVPTGAVVATITGTNAIDFTATSACTLLAPLAGCTVSVVFTPKAVAATSETATLTITDSGVGASTVSVPLTGTAFTPSTLAITPTTSDLGTVLLGATGAATTFTVTNNGDTASGSLAVSSSNAEFVIANDTCTGTSIAKSATCTVAIALKPATIGAKSATLSVIGSNGLPAVKTLTGTGISAGSLSATPASLDFGSVRINNTGTAQTVTVKNGGGTATGALTFTKSGNFGAFPIAANTCSAALAPAATCTFTVNFAPTAVGSQTASYTVTDGTASAVVAVSGNALAAAVLVLTPSPVGVCSLVVEQSNCFNPTVIGGTSNTQTFTVTADTLPPGVADTGAITVALAGTNATEFTIATNQCTSALLAGATCTVSVTFNPTVAGIRQATLSVTSINGGAAAATLQGNGLALVEIKPLTLTDESQNKITGLDFGQVTVLSSTEPNGHSRQFQVTVRGPSSTASHTTTTSVALTDPSLPADFKNQGDSLTNPCDGAALDFSGTPSANSTAWTYSAVDVGFICTSTIVFYPQSTEGAKTATLAAGESVGGGSDSKTLTGVAAGTLTFNPSPALFPNTVQVGSSTNAQVTTSVTMLSPDDVVVTLTNNSGTTDQGPLAIVLGGTNVDQFIIVQDLCSHATLGHTNNTRTCTVAVAFVPTSVGPKTATLTATAGTETASVVINATAGTGFAITVSPSGNPTAVDFGTAVETTVTWLTFTVSNPTGAPKSAQIDYDWSGSHYILADGTNHALGTCGLAGSTALAAGANCTIFVAFKPLAADTIGNSYTGTLMVSGDAFTTEVDVPLTGKVASQLTITPAPPTFPDTAEGATSAAVTLTVANTGLTVANLTITSNTNLAPFSVDQGTGCAAATALAAGGTCALVVTYIGQVPANGAYPLPNPSANIPLVVSTAANNSTATAKLSGNTVKPAKLVAVGVSNDIANAPLTVNLGGVRKGNQSGDAILWFQNTGSVKTSNLHYQWAGLAIDTADTEFVIVSEATGSCVGLSSLAAQGLCSVTVHFAPSSTSALGTRTPKGLTISADQGGIVAMYALTATALDPANSGWIASTTGTNAFFAFPGMTPAAPTTPPSQVFQFTNATASTIAVSTIAVASSSVANNFSVVTTGATAGNAPCGAGGAVNIAASASCTFAVVFNPTAWSATTAYRWATIGTGATTLGVFATVQSPAALVLTPATLDFGQVLVGGSAALTFTVQNNGQTASAAVNMTLTASGITGSNPTKFAVTGNCNAAIPAAGTCTGTLTVNPGATLGVINAHLQAVDGTASEASATIAPTATSVIDTSLALSAATMTFPSQAVLTTSTAQTITISDLAGARDSGPLTVALQDQVNFTLVATGVNDCVTGTNFGAATTPVGVTGTTPCTVAVEFIPQTLGTGTFTSNLTFTGTPGGTKTVAITGTAASAMTINATSPTVLAGPHTYTVTLNAAAPTTAYVTTGLSGGNYFVTLDECVATKLTGGDTCQITVVPLFTAATPTKTGTLTVSGGNPGNSVSLVLNSQ